MYLFIWYSIDPWYHGFELRKSTSQVFSIQSFSVSPSSFQPTRHSKTIFAFLTTVFQLQILNCRQKILLPISVGSICGCEGGLESRKSYVDFQLCSVYTPDQFAVQGSTVLCFAVPKKAHVWRGDLPPGNSLSLLIAHYFPLKAEFWCCIKIF